MSDYENLRYERDGHVTVLTYDRPEQRNAVSRQMNAELHDAWGRFRDSDDAFVLVITGEGEAFCAGWDLADAAETTAGDWDEFRTHVYNSPGDCGYSRRIDVGKALERAMELAHEVAALPQGAIRADKETMVRNVGRTYEEQLRSEVEMSLSMFMRRDGHAIGARAFKEGRTPEWPHHGL